jgi:2-iminobutanoate/2-iminopropanoate deaminase
MAWRESFDIPPVMHNAPIPMITRVGNMIFTSGVMGSDPKTGEMPESVEEQARNCFTNLINALAKAGATAGDVGHINVMIKETGYRTAVNPPWLELFPDEHSRPARHALVVPSLNFAIQIEAIAVVQG